MNNERMADGCDDYACGEQRFQVIMSAAEESGEVSNIARYIYKNMWEGSRRPFRAHIYSEISGGLVVVIGGRWWQTIGDVGYSCPWEALMTLSSKVICDSRVEIVFWAMAHGACSELDNSTANRSWLVMVLRPSNN